MKEFGGRAEVNETSASQQMERPQMSPEVREKYERLTGLDKIPKNENKDKEMSVPEGERPIDVAKKDELPKPDSDLQSKYEELSGLSKLKAYLDKSSENVGQGDVAETKKEQKGYSKYLDKGEDGKWYDKETGKTYDTVDDWLKAQETLAKRYEGAADYYQKKADKAWARYKNAESNGDSADKKSQNYLESKKCYEKAKECREKAAAIREKIGQQPKSEEVSVSDKNNEYKDNKKHNETEEQKDVGDKQRKDGSNAEKNSERETEKETRELTDEEKQWLKDTLGWSDKQIDKCTIDKDGVIHYRTDRSDLEGKTSENGVPYERKQIVINGVRIEGVFPNFDSVYTTELSPEKQKSNAYAKECNANLKEAVNNDPELRKKFTKEQLEDIENGRTPTGYVWHHNEEQGKMELVKKEDHDRTSGGAAHTGGSVLWGPDSSASKGDKF